MQKLAEGAVFETVAEELAAARGVVDSGEYEWVRTDELDDSVARAVGQLDAGDHTQVIDTGAAFVIVSLAGRKAESVQPLSEVHARIMVQIRKELAEERYDEWIERLRSKSYIEMSE